MILVTGAAGHLGNALVRELVARGRTDVRAVLHLDPDPESLRGMPVERVVADITRPETLAAAFAGVDEVVHLASLVSIGEAPEHAVLEVNVTGTANVLAAARAAGVRRLLYVGTSHAFQPHAADLRIDETCPLATTGEPYERSKADATRLALAADGIPPGAPAGTRDLEVVVAAPGGVIGPLDYNRSEIGSQVRRWALLGAGVTVPGGYDFSDVRDIAVGLLQVLEQGRRGECYLLSGTHVEITDLARAAVRAADRRGPVVQLPAGAARLIARASLATSRWRRHKPTFTPYAVATLLSRVTVDSSKARAELGYRPRPLADTIEDTTTWWLAHPKLGGERRLATPAPAAVTLGSRS